ncbi:type VI secretion system protein ImpF [Variovorax boronicumulans]|uniref:type VI secretion system baseplate subunit TssE n=1 Tax=Variovorax boronicumulans TaxID=436515 RepID=UPI0027865875|nr:type VI secretion system baseplate subunit TssE [Variovorax boronicumulans]MDP9992727.1 type VI secretion system protein ImpF [Variovorax boronicumulans]MDQ0004182.1 type VI secretion system protein ImpF [Variovorax boronicumulans]
MRSAEQSSPFTGSHPAHPGARSLRPADAPATHPNAQLLPTLFDRLRDEAPSRTSELPSEYAVTPAQMRDIVQRDLAYLLNTTNAEDLIDRARHAEAASSTINFGVPPLAGSYLSERRWADIERIIRRAIQDYEPRLIPETVTVVPLMKEGGAAGEYNVLLFEIRALIHLRPYPLAFTVQSAVDLETNRMRVISSAR